MNICSEFKKEKCSEQGEQASNLTEEQQQGLKSLKLRIKNKEIVVLKTDKSGKLCVATTEEYIKMGYKHTKKDKIIYRREIQEIEKNINGHTFAWTKMWDTGGEHGQQGRVLDGKITHSENISVMYLVVKDQKKDPGESRPIVTGCSGNTRGLSNSVSNFLESVANSIESNFERISSEDMLSNTKKANKEVEDLIRTWRNLRLSKFNCNKCAYNEENISDCQSCHEEGVDNKIMKMENKYDCDDCGREWRDQMELECEECGDWRD